MPIPTRILNQQTGSQKDLGQGQMFGAHIIFFVLEFDCIQEFREVIEHLNNTGWQYHTWIGAVYRPTKANIEWMQAGTQPEADIYDNPPTGIHNGHAVVVDIDYSSPASSDGAAKYVPSGGTYRALCEEF